MSKPTVSSVQKNASVVAIDYVEDARGKGFRLFLKNASSRGLTSSPHRSLASAVSSDR